MNRNHQALAAFTVIGLGMPSVCGADDGTQFFAQHIQPIFEAKCHECHSHEVKKSKGGLMLDSAAGWRAGGDSGAVIVPGKPEESLLFRAVSYLEKDMEMPPKERLSPEQVARIREWIVMGAPDPRGAATQTARKDDAWPVKADALWSLKPVTQPPVPAVKESAWPLSEVDRFLLARMEKEGVKPVADAAPERLLRRVFYDLTGLPPSPQDVEAFLDSPTREAFEGTVDRLIASPQFGERWGRHWLDTARYADTLGGDSDRPLRHAWRYRDWVYDAVNADMPYDRFLTEQIAGDLLPADDWQQRERQQVATGFLAVGVKPLPRILPVTPEKDIEGEYERAYNDWADDQIDAVGRGMLGLTVACARCHDHKFDPVPTRDYYALAGIFRSTELKFSMPHFLIAYEPERDFPIEPWYWFTGEPGQIAKAQAMTAAWFAADEKRRPLRGESRRLESKIKEADAALKRPDATRTAKEKELIAARDANAQKLDEVRAEFLKAGEIAGPKPDVRLAIGAREGRPMDASVLTRGEWNRKTETVPRGLLSTLSGVETDTIPADASGRLQLAHWVASSDNPLTGRVAVNRVWHHLFGRGIVESLDNFGAMGARPTHPELLDWLAHRFSHELGWSVKKLVRELVLTRAYQLASTNDDASFTADPEVKLFWRARPRRLESEAVRDSLLVVAGMLELKRPAANPLADTLYKGNTTGDREAAEAEKKRFRSVYVPVVRGRLAEFQTLFDQPVPSEPNSARNAGTLPGQGLFFLNSKLAADTATAVANRLLNDRTLANDDARMQRACLLVLNRRPTADELARDRALLANEALGGEQQAWTAMCLSMLMSSEFLYRF